MNSGGVHGIIPGRVGAAAEPGARGSHAPHESGRSLKPRPAPASRVLVVDDDPDLRSLLAAVLDAEGYNVLTAENGAAALSVLRTVLPDIIILDLMMPVMNGWQFRETQKDVPEYARIPIVCLSAYPAARHQAMALGMTACVQKPFEIDDLLDAIRRSLTR
jgi:two-component system, chemotaxis family, chemotaxis protein CheY